MEINIQSVFKKIREISDEGLQPRPYININILEAELRTGIDRLGPHLADLKKMRLIIFNQKAMTAVKLTQMGLWSELTS